MSAAAGGRARRPLSSTVAGWSITLALLALAALFVADRLYDPEQFRIREVEVRGRFVRVDSGQIREVVEQSISGNYFSLSLPAIESRIKQLPWVFGASVRKRWPGTLVVDVDEIQPMARWGRHRWLNATGDLVARDPGPVAQNLPRLSGPEGRQQAVWRAFGRWSEMFAASGLNLEQLELDARGLWRLELTLNAPVPGRRAAAANGKVAPRPVVMIVEQGGAEERIALFTEALRRRLLAELPSMRAVDLRYPNGFAVSWNTPPPGVRRLATAQ